MTDHRQPKAPFHITGPTELIACGHAITKAPSSLTKCSYNNRLQAIISLLRITAIPEQHVAEVVTKLRFAAGNMTGDQWRRIRDIADWLEQDEREISAQPVTEIEFARTEAPA